MPKKVQLVASGSTEDVSNITQELLESRRRLEAGVEENRRNREVLQGLNDQVDRHSETININIDPSMFGREREDEADREIEGLINKLKAELFKNNTLEEINDMLKAENDAALTANVNLRTDVSELTRTLEFLSREYRDEQDRFRIENQRYRSHLDTQHRQLISLWKAFLAVKRQMKELKTLTAADMEKQMGEFARCTQMMQKAIKQAEGRTSTVQHQMTREKDEVVNEVFKKYEELSERNAEVEKQNSEKSRRIAKLETELRREKEEKEGIRDALGKISNMPELTQNKEGKPRSRSQSPGSPGTSGGEAMRKIRSTLHARNVELKDLQMKLERSEAQTERLQRDIERLEKELKTRAERDRQREEEAKKREHELADLEKQSRRADERMQSAEEDKQRLQENIQQLQDSIAHIHKLQREFIETLTERHKEELDVRQKHYETESEERINEERTRATRIKDELERTKNDGEGLRQQLRDVQADLATVRKAMEDKEMLNTHLSDEIKRIREQLAEAQAGEDDKDKAIHELRAKYEHAKDKEKRVKAELAEVSGTIDIMTDENKSLQDQAAETREQMNEMGNRLEQASQREEELEQQSEELNSTIEKHEETIRELKASLQEAQTRAEAREQFAYARNMAEQRAEESQVLEREREQALREKDMAQDELNNRNHEVAALNAKIATMEKDISGRIEQDHQVKLLIDEIRSKNDQLERDVSEKNAIIEDMRDKLEDLHNDLIKRDERSKAEVAKIEEIKTTDILTVREEWTQKARAQEADLESLRRHLADMEARSKELTLEVDRLKTENEVLEIDRDQAVEKQEDETRRLKKKIEELEEQALADREEYEELRAKETKQRDEAMSQVTEEFKRLQGMIDEIGEKESILQKQLDDTKEELAKEKSINDTRQEELGRLHQNISQLEQQLDSERKLGHNKFGPARRSVTVFGTLPRNVWREPLPDYRIHESITQSWQVEEHEVRIARSQTQYDELSRNKDMLESERDRLVTLIAKKTTAIQNLESQADELTAQLAEAEARENSLRDELALFTREASELRHAVERHQQLLAERSQKCEEQDQRIRELQKEVHLKQIEADHRREESDDAQEAKMALQNKVQALELQLADKTAKLESTTDLLKKLENTEKNMMTELKEDAEKVTHYRRRNEELKISTSKLTEEVTTLKTLLERKTQQSQRALADLLDNYKEAERKAHSNQAEADQLRAGVLGLEAKLERAERRKTELEAKLAEAEGRRDELAVRNSQYERSAAIGIGKHSSMRTGNSTLDLSHDHHSSYGSIGAPVSIPHLRGSVSTQNMSADFSPERSVHFDDSGERLKALGITPSMDITIRYLKERIEQLEKERTSLTQALGDSRQSEKLAKRRLDEVTQLLDSLQRKAEQLENDNKLLEGRMNNQRQMYLSNEESMRSREGEFRTLKAKLMSAELHVREKESKIQQLLTLVDTQKLDLAEQTEEKRKLVSQMIHLEKDLKTAEQEGEKGDLERGHLAVQLDNLQQDLKNLKKQLIEMEQVNDSQRKAMEEMKMSEDRRREAIERAQAEERHWRNTAVAAKKTSEEYHRSIYEERLGNLQRNYDTLHTTHEQLQTQAERLRQELKEALNKSNSSTNRLREAESRLDDELQKRKLVEKALSSMQKMETDWQKLERELRDELKLLRKDKLSNTAEIEELKRRLTRCEVERREIEAARVRLEREVAALKKHVDALEEDRSRTDEAVKQTVSEKRAMDKSLAAMEKENSELYRNCTQLQTQIQHLERDTGTKSVTKMLKEHAELEARFGKMLQEKRQLEMLLEQKEMNYAHKKKLLESQLGLLREQLEAERKRR
ncbi:unnamed protein product, partial [Mesorhabditis spiculigera]